MFAAFNTLDVFNLLEIVLIDTDMAQNEPQRKETPPGPSPLTIITIRISV